MKEKERAEIAKRALEFVDGLPYRFRWQKLRICEMKHNIVYEWEKGTAPSALHLKRLAELGADVHYILTGKRKE
jgi:hypothetical protein